MNYSEKLKDPRWQKKRLEIFERDNFACQSCGDNESTLNVHHFIYKAGFDPWEYDNNYYITLCENCHKNEYAERESFEKMLLEVLKYKKFLTEHIAELTKGINNLKQVHLLEVQLSALTYAFGNEEIQTYIIDKYFTSLNEKHKENG